MYSMHKVFKEDGQCGVVIQKKLALMNTIPTKMVRYLRYKFQGSSLVHNLGRGGLWVIQQSYFLCI